MPQQPRDLIIERLNAEKQSYSGFCLKGLVCGGVCGLLALLLLSPEPPPVTVRERPPTLIQLPQHARSAAALVEPVSAPGQRGGDRDHAAPPRPKRQLCG